MGLFGNLDASQVSDDPFYVAPDKYKCVLTEFGLKEKSDQTGWGLATKWVIEDDDSEYEGQNLSEWLTVYPDGLDEEDITPEIRKTMARTKQRLLQMGLDNDQMDALMEDESNFDLYIGMEAYVDVVETPDKVDPDKKWTNIRKVTRIYDDE